MSQLNTDIASASSNIGFLTSSVTVASADIVAGNTVTHDDPTLDPVARYLQNHISAIDLNYNDSLNAELSDLRIANRLDELQGLDNAVDNSTATVKSVANTRVQEAKGTIDINKRRIESDDAADKASKSLRKSVIEDALKALEAVGRLNRKKVIELLDEPKVDNTKLDKFKDKDKDNNGKSKSIKA